ncbi:MAG: hypothetical protein K8963_08790, partial [Proteobacteria bacterium]|nr:hypothetical protein [Pseudomonadota bacterium]
EHAAKLAYIGVPRFAIKDIKQQITDSSLYDDINALRRHMSSSHFSLEQDESKNKIVNRIIKHAIL